MFNLRNTRCVDDYTLNAIDIAMDKARKHPTRILASSETCFTCLICFVTCILEVASKMMTLYSRE